MSSGGTIFDNSNNIWRCFCIEGGVARGLYGPFSSPESLFHKGSEELVVLVFLWGENIEDRTHLELDPKNVFKLL